ncbi:multidrug ABC transporter ATP-binding protein [Candidatus Nanosynbacter lyticus]|uniref:Multidrug ABC transporter ATP-binding protein n=1 Tax=Candidatus Nanosynbacter lyticus TaxID=2093824 RepID=A0A6S4GR38_9BACT|nr:ABC transporter ATP-binding protein [Candidatus Nanosynbacter lyticus]AJA06636.1 multidrug ABC transporter ATP-binding protein [Candidatus Nanosynbacter lyticus]QCT41797.1 ABC transporter ATP-binding protein [TM7 phylum sp. oral taxon 952]
MKHILRIFSGYWLMFIILVCFTYAMVMANLWLPDKMSEIVNNGIIKQDMPAIWHNGLVMILVTAAGGLCSIVIGFLASRIATGMAQKLRTELFERVESFALADFNKFSTASLITRSTNDIQQIQMTSILLLRLALMAPIMAIGGLQKAVHNAPDLSWIIALAVSVLLVVIAVLFVIAVPRFKKLQTLVDKLNLVTRENLVGLKVIRAFHNEKIEQKKFQQANTELNKMNLFVNRLMMLLDPIMTLVMNFSSVAIVWFGAHLISSGNLQIGNMMAFLEYAMQVIISFLLLSMVFIMVPRAAVSVKRVGEVLDTLPSIVDPPSPQQLPHDATGKIEFKDVTFTYPDADLPVLSSINFTAEPGQTTAFIGSTGSGKSTLINLIPRFYDVSAGQILLDGVDIRQLKLEDLYDQIGYVPQKGVLFSGTIASNIKYGNAKASKKLVEKSAKIAQATEFIGELKNGYKNDIAQGGSNVSGGQRQRLSIARAIAVEPNVYIFDDSFSALDFKTDATLRSALAKETKHKTVLIVGQRINTITNADKIIVLDEGKIVGQGTHQELMKNCQVYQEIAASQLSEDDLQKMSATTAKGAA